MVSMELLFPVIECIDIEKRNTNKTATGILSVQNFNVYFCGETTNFCSFVQWVREAVFDYIHFYTNIV
jgi:hypothetical protein